MLRLATFNLENLFARYRFRQDVAPGSVGWSVNETAFELYDLEEKRVTAQAIKAADADVLCLQEVESLPVLDRFASLARYEAASREQRQELLLERSPQVVAGALDTKLLERFLHLRRVFPAG